MKVVVDAYAWIEYLSGSIQGKAVGGFLQQHECFTSAVTLAEMISKIKRSGGNVQLLLDAVFSLSQVIAASESIAMQAGIIHAEQRRSKPQFGLGDSFVAGTSFAINAKILTNDPHFRGFKNAILLGSL